MMTHWYYYTCTALIVQKKSGAKSQDIPGSSAVVMVTVVVVVVVAAVMMMAGENSFDFLPVVQTNFINQTLIKQLLPPNWDTTTTHIVNKIILDFNFTIQF